MADYVILWSKSSGMVARVWPRTTSDNASTMIADGHLTVDGVEVASGFLGAGDTDAAACVLSDPSVADPAAPPYTIMVDDPEVPGDTYAIPTRGERDAVYYEDVDELGLMLP